MSRKKEASASASSCKVFSMAEYRVRKGLPPCPMEVRPVASIPAMMEYVFELFRGAGDTPETTRNFNEMMIRTQLEIERAGGFRFVWDKRYHLSKMG